MTYEEIKKQLEIKGGYFLLEKIKKHPPKCLSLEQGRELVFKYNYWGKASCVKEIVCYSIADDEEAVGFFINNISEMLHLDPKTMQYMYERAEAAGIEIPAEKQTIAWKKAGYPLSLKPNNDKVVKTLSGVSLISSVFIHHVDYATLSTKNKLKVVKTLLRIKEIAGCSISALSIDIDEIVDNIPIKGIIEGAKIMLFKPTKKTVEVLGNKLKLYRLSAPEIDTRFYDFWNTYQSFIEEAMTMGFQIKTTVKSDAIRIRIDNIDNNLKISLTRLSMLPGLKVLISKYLNNENDEYNWCLYPWNAKKETDQLLSEMRKIVRR